MSDQRLIKGTLVLTMANLINRLLGLVNQVLVLRLIGSEGYGLFQLAIPIYLLALVITTAGIPVAVSKLVAEELVRGNQWSARQILRWSVIRLGIIGLGFAITLAILLPSAGSKIMADPRAIWCVLVLIPALPITAISSALRGYFQGIQRMTIPAVA
ncbi:MAG: oligosaccharide flippase family protein, partial [Syntrophomonadaceae bacterium]|nr:oligosaccharide flippase family protein [Syntrophomonadaceae bacterium]